MSKQRAVTKKGTAIEKPRDPSTRTIAGLPGDTWEKSVGRAACEPTGKAAALVRPLSSKLFDGADVDFQAVREVLAETVKAVQGGDMRASDEMLVAQSYALDALFHHLVGKSLAHMTINYTIADGLARLALKAQSQSRANWETLSRVKNPPTFVRQANIANGPQQVNNGPARDEGFATSTRAGAEARPGKTESPQNELLPPDAPEGGSHGGMD